MYSYRLAENLDISSFRALLQMVKKQETKERKKIIVHIFIFLNFSQT